jgi:hypothetical protein
LLFQTFFPFRDSMYREMLDFFRSIFGYQTDGLINISVIWRGRSIISQKKVEEQAYFLPSCK